MLLQCKNCCARMFKIPFNLFFLHIDEVEKCMRRKEIRYRIPRCDWNTPLIASIVRRCVNRIDFYSPSKRPSTKVLRLTRKCAQTSLSWSRLYLTHLTHKATFNQQNFAKSFHMFTTLSTVAQQYIRTSKPGVVLIGIHEIEQNAWCAMCGTTYDYSQYSLIFDP